MTFSQSSNTSSNESNGFIKGMKSVGNGFMWGMKAAAPIAGAVLVIGLAMAGVAAVTPNKN